MHLLDTLLAGGGIRATSPVYDHVAGRRRIAEKLAARRNTPAPEEHTGAEASCCRPAPPAPQSLAAWADPDDLASPGPPGTCAQSPLPVDAQGLTFHDHADRDLRTLASMVIGEEGAAAALHRLHQGTVEPRGALVFACLLHLVSRYQEAQFWWQLAGGAEDATACLCLYLHHLRLGELKPAEHWFSEAARLEEPVPPGRPTVPPAVPPIPDYYLACLPMVGEYLKTLGAIPQPPDTALREALDELDTVRDAEYGPISLPSDELADQLATMS
ncbi:hypothetical protein ABZW30_13045 [Kitasatospora sp. NPDC004669]|uniref:hypothetical protein n=1 Tax=Kitasatospora sp. NPDC004669 TaxID=3154555 RepID=UPI0033A67828